MKSKMTEKKNTPDKVIFFDDTQEAKLEIFSSSRKTMMTEPITSVVTEKEPKIISNPLTDKVIGKIKIPIGFNLNPQALLPESKPPSMKHEMKYERASGSGLRSDSRGIKSVGTSLKDPTDSVHAVPSSSSGFLDSKVYPTLYNATKERVKIQGKRRPQTQKARHDAIRSSALLENVDFRTMKKN